MAIQRASINTNWPAENRYRGLREIIDDVLAETDPGGSNTNKRKWITWQFLYIIWWEGTRATERVQRAGGPARGLMQMEPATFWDVLEFYVSRDRSRVQLLAGAADVSFNEMDEALDDFRRNNLVSDGSRGRNSWPGSGNRRKVEDWMTNVDSFALLYMRFYFKRFGRHRFPPADSGDLSRNPQGSEFKKEFSNGWAEWWKRAFSSPEDRSRQIRNFETRARDLDDASRGVDVPPPDDGGGDDNGGRPPRGGDPDSGNPPPRGGGSSGCFIATAVYGLDSWQVNSLRVFRDERLLKNSIGKMLIKIYYRTSPPIARLLNRTPRIRAVVKSILDKIVKN